MQSVTISTTEVEKLFAVSEGHFVDFKGKAIAPGKLTRTVSGFAESSVLLIIRHEQLASPEERIMSFLESHATISNGEAREVCVIREDWRVRSIFARMVGAGMLEKVPGSSTSNTAYRKRV